MLIRNVGAPRFISSPNHDFYTDEIPHLGEIEVSGELAKSLLEQTDVWQKATTKPTKKSAKPSKAVAKKSAAHVVPDVPVTVPPSDVTATAEGDGN